MCKLNVSFLFYFIFKVIPTKVFIYCCNCFYIFILFYSFFFKYFILSYNFMYLTHYEAHVPMTFPPFFKVRNYVNRCVTQRYI